VDAPLVGVLEVGVVLAPGLAVPATAVEDGLLDDVPVELDDALPGAVVEPVVVESDATDSLVALDAAGLEPTPALMPWADVFVLVPGSGASGASCSRGSSTLMWVCET
jgi:hypothetical protein